MWLLVLWACLSAEDCPSPDKAEYFDYWVDGDGDGYGYGHTYDVERWCRLRPGFAANRDDCDDTNPSTYPDAPELCDGLDNNCNGRTDGKNEIEQLFWYADQDGDGFGDPLSEVLDCAPPEADWIDMGDDCDDSMDAVFPGATEICNGLDDNCIGGIDEAPLIDFDEDEDGYLACGDGDCDDGDAKVYPGAFDACDDHDNDCDGYANQHDMDAWEPNDSLAAAVWVAGNDTWASVTPNFNSVDDAMDVFLVETENDIEFLINTFYISADVTDVPEGVTLTMELWSEGYYGYDLEDSDSGTGDLHVAWFAQSIGIGGGGDWLIVVKPTSGVTPCGETYTFSTANGG
jgi:hypothetical protein